MLCVYGVAVGGIWAVDEKQWWLRWSESWKGRLQLL